MDILKKENKEKYTKQFSKWDKCLKDAKVSTVEALYKKIHDEIRKNPEHIKAKRAKEAVRKVISKEKGVRVQQNSKGKKWLRHFRLTNAQRKERVQAKMVKAMEKMQQS